MKASIHTPKHNKRPGTVVVSPFGFRGNPENSKEWLDIAADLACTTFVGLQRPGTLSTVFDLGMRRSLHPTRFEQTTTDKVDEFRDAVEAVAGHFDTLTGHGASGGGALICALAKLGIFKRITLRDMANLRAQTGPENTATGTANFIRYLLIGERNKPHDLTAPNIPHIPERYSIGQMALHGLTEIWHYQQLMLSTYTADTVKELASDSQLPIRHVGLRHTFSGSADVAGTFAHVLEEQRAQANSALQQQHPKARAAGLLATIEYGLYHSDLVTRPDIMARHVEEMFALEEAVLPQTS
jgi:hypothetical protein